MRIWCDLQLSDNQWATLRAGAAPHEIIRSSEQDPRLDLLDGATVALGHPPVDVLIGASSVRWVQVGSAGYDRYQVDAFREAITARAGVVTNSSSVFAEPCAQHLLAMMLAFARRLPECWQAQQRHQWRRPRPEARLLNEQRVLLVGLGAIGHRLIELLAPLGMELRGVRRTRRGDEPIAVITPDAIDPWLGWADHIVNILPGGEATTHFFNAGRIGAFRPEAYFYNVGRGTSVDQPALIAALHDGRLAGAYLDVTDPEPLPADHPLWTAPRCHITPHIAGAHASAGDRLIAHFVANLRRWERGEPLSDQVL